MIVHSNGMGVQSVTIAAMACLGDLPMPTTSIFADPGWESAATYAYRDWFVEWAWLHGLDIVTVSQGSLREDAIANKRGAQIPLYSLNVNEAGKNVRGMLMRQCTSEYKIKPLRAEVKRQLGVAHGREVKDPVVMWLGISMDEVVRMKDSPLKWIRHEYPLIDKRMTRQDCLDYLKSKKLGVPPKSACIGCPFKSDAAWRELSAPEMADAVDFDAKIRQRKGMDSAFFLHPARVPLSTVPLAGAPSSFENECEGHCGV